MTGGILWSVEGLDMLHELFDGRNKITYVLITLSCILCYVTARIVSTCVF